MPALRRNTSFHSLQELHHQQELQRQLILEMRQRQELHHWMALQHTQSSLTSEQLLQLQITSSILMNPNVNSAITQLMGPATMVWLNGSICSFSTAAAGLPIVLHPEPTTRNSASNRVATAPPGATAVGVGETALEPFVPASTNDPESRRLAYECVVDSAGIFPVDHIEKSPNRISKNSE
jgi:hypothetical protein